MFVGLRKGDYATASLPSSLVGAAKELKGYAVRVRPYEYSFDMIQPNFWPNAAGIGGLFNRLYFREAMRMGINQSAIIKTFYHGYAAYECTAAAPAPKNRIYDAGTCHVFANYNPARGRALLEAHGWKLVNGVMQRGGVKLAFTMPYQSGSNTDTHIAEYLKSTWAKEDIGSGQVCVKAFLCRTAVGRSPPAPRRGPGSVPPNWCPDSHNGALCPTLRVVPGMVSTS